MRAVRCGQPRAQTALYASKLPVKSKATHFANSKEQCSRLTTAYGPHLHFCTFFSKFRNHNNCGIHILKGLKFLAPSALRALVAPL